MTAAHTLQACKRSRRGHWPQTVPSSLCLLSRPPPRFSNRQGAQRPATAHKQTSCAGQGCTGPPWGCAAGGRRAPPRGNPGKPPGCCAMPMRVLTCHQRCGCRACPPVRREVRESSPADARDAEAICVPAGSRWRHAQPCWHCLAPCMQPSCCSPPHVQEVMYGLEASRRRGR